MSRYAKSALSTLLTLENLSKTKRGDRSRFYMYYSDTYQYRVDHIAACFKGKRTDYSHIYTKEFMYRAFSCWSEPDSNEEFADSWDATLLEYNSYDNPEFKNLTTMSIRNYIGEDLENNSLTEYHQVLRKLNS